ncbi:hypothetical protein OF83DRAFT_1179104 [Amylostereum chailletii]|nr:hypothetical protein OF83DRAFT_1179104 [Amylostereum chailletii]
MRATVAFLAFFLALAGRVLALNITIGGDVGMINADRFLTINDTQLNSECGDMCKPGFDAIAACNEDDNCFCDADTVGKVVMCQQCYFTHIIADNRKMPDPRAGSTPALTAYGSACNASLNMIIPPTSLALTLPANWDGPAAVELSTGLTVITVLAGGLLGIASIGIVITM